jgi:branched-chain amino acid transport system substrate-binding protein
MKRFVLARVVISTCVLMLLTASACRSSEADVVGTPVTQAPHVDKPKLQVALLGATQGESMFSAQHAMEGARLAFDLANQAGGLPVDVIAVAGDTMEDSSVVTGQVSEAAGDPSYVGIVAWTSSPESPALAAAAAAGGLPVISVSPVAGGGTTDGFWSRMVAPDKVLAESVAHLRAASAGRRPVCVTADDGPRGLDLVRWVTAALASRGVDVGFTQTVTAEQPDYVDLVGNIADAHCSLVFWGGGTTEGGLIRAEMTEAGLPEAVMIGVDTLVAGPFATAAGPAGEGTIAACACTDVSTSTSLDAQEFIQGYQSKYGNPPSAFAVEGWDAAQRIIAAVDAGNVDRATIGRFLSEQRQFAGLGSSYVFDAQGESANSGVYLYELREGTWTSASS